MLCFLPTLPGPPRDYESPRPAPRPPGLTAAIVVALVALCALLAPFGSAYRPHTTARAATAPVPAGSPPLAVPIPVPDTPRAP